MVSTCGLILAPQSVEHEILATVVISCSILSRIHFSVDTKSIQKLYLRCCTLAAHCPIPAVQAEGEAAEAVEAADVAEASVPAEAAEVPAAEVPPAEVQLTSSQSKHGCVARLVTCIITYSPKLILVLAIAWSI